MSSSFKVAQQQRELRRLHLKSSSPSPRALFFALPWTPPCTSNFASATRGAVSPRAALSCRLIPSCVLLWREEVEVTVGLGCLLLFSEGSGGGRSNTPLLPLTGKQTPAAGNIRVYQGVSAVLAGLCALLLLLTVALAVKRECLQPRVGVCVTDSQSGSSAGSRRGSRG